MKESTGEQAGRQGEWRLSRDGVLIMEGSEYNCWTYLHRMHPYSVDHACKHEGFKLEKIEEEDKSV